MAKIKMRGVVLIKGLLFFIMKEKRNSNKSNSMKIKVPLTQKRSVLINHKLIRNLNILLRKRVPKDKYSPSYMRMLKEDSKTILLLENSKVMTILSFKNKIYQGKRNLISFCPKGQKKRSKQGYCNLIFRMKTKH